MVEKSKKDKMDLSDAIRLDLNFLREQINLLQLATQQNDEEVPRVPGTLYLLADKIDNLESLTDRLYKTA